MEEKSFFSQGNVSVSNARFIANGQTYALSGITAVESFQQNPSRKLPIVLGIVCVLMLAGGGTVLFIGLALIAGAVGLWFMQKPEFQVRLSTASG